MKTAPRLLFRDLAGVPVWGNVWGNVWGRPHGVVGLAKREFKESREEEVPGGSTPVNPGFAFQVTLWFWPD